MRSGDPAVETAFGELFLETDNSREALKSFQIVIKAAANWAPACRRRKTIAGENPPMARLRPKKPSRSTLTSLTRIVLAGLDLDNTR